MHVVHAMRLPAVNCVCVCVSIHQVTNYNYDWCCVCYSADCLVHILGPRQRCQW